MPMRLMGYVKFQLCLQASLRRSQAQAASFYHGMIYIDAAALSAAAQAFTPSSFPKATPLTWFQLHVFGIFLETTIPAESIGGFVHLRGSWQHSGICRAINLDIFWTCSELLL